MKLSKRLRTVQDGDATCSIDWRIKLAGKVKAATVNGFPWRADGANPSGPRPKVKDDPHVSAEALVKLESAKERTKLYQTG